MKIHNRAKFHCHSICDSQVINFRFLGPNSPKYDPILLKLAPQVVLKERNRVFQKVLPNSNFQRNWTLSKFNFFFSFGPTLGPIYPMKEAEIEKNKKIQRLNSGTGLSKNRKIKAVPLLPFKRKIGLLFALFGAFLGKKMGGVKD